MYGVNFTPPASGGLKFGLNQEVYLTKFEFNPNGGKDKSPQDCLDMTFNISGKEISNRQFPFTSVKDWENEIDITDRTHPLFVAAVSKFNSYITQLLLCYASQEEITAAFEAEAPESFKAFCAVCADILGEDFAEVSLDLFAHYQWNLPPGAERKYLELPKYNHVNQGRWVVSSVEGEFEQIDGDGLMYKNKEGIKHPFTRNARYMSTERARSGAVSKQQASPDDDFGF